MSNLFNKIKALVIFAAACAVFSGCGGGDNTNSNTAEVLKYELAALDMSKDGDFEGAEKTAIAVSGDGQYLYVGTKEGLYVRKKGEEDFKLVAGINEGTNDPANFPVAKKKSDVEIVTLKATPDGVMARGLGDNNLEITDPKDKNKKIKIQRDAFIWVAGDTVKGTLTTQVDDDEKGKFDYYDITDTDTGESAMVLSTSNYYTSAQFSLLNDVNGFAKRIEMTNNNPKNQNYFDGENLSFLQINGNLFFVNIDELKYVTFNKAGRKTTGFSTADAVSDEGKDETWPKAPAIDREKLKVVGQNEDNELISLLHGNGKQGFFCLEHANDKDGGIALFDGVNITPPPTGGFTTVAAANDGNTSVFTGKFGLIKYDGNKKEFSPIINIKWSTDNVFAKKDNGTKAEQVSGFEKPMDEESFKAIAVADGKYYLISGTDPTKIYVLKTETFKVNVK